MQGAFLNCSQYLVSASCWCSERFPQSFETEIVEEWLIIYFFVLIFQCRETGDTIPKLSLFVQNSWTLWKLCLYQELGGMCETNPEITQLDHIYIVRGIRLCQEFVDCKV